MDNSIRLIRSPWSRTDTTCIHICSFKVPRSDNMLTAFKEGNLPRLRAISYAQISVIRFITAIGFDSIDIIGHLFKPIRNA